MRTFFTADQHLGHLGIIAMANRIDPATGALFSNVNRHDAFLIDMHNAVVSPKDRVIMVGDFAHRCDPKRMAAIFGRLNGQKFLVPGNHDDSQTLRLSWAGCQQIMQIAESGVRVVACHFALRTWMGASRGAIHVYGHSHGKLPGNNRSCDVGVDCWDFRPVSLPEIQARLAILPAPTDVEGDPEPDNDGVTP